MNTAIICSPIFCDEHLGSQVFVTKSSLAINILIYFACFIGTGASGMFSRVKLLNHKMGEF